MKTIEQIVKEIKTKTNKSKWGKKYLEKFLHQYTTNFINHPKAWCEVEDYRSELERINWNVSDVFYLFYQRELDKDFMREVLSHLNSKEHDNLMFAILEHIFRDVMSEYAYMVERFQRNIEKLNELEDLVKDVEDIVNEGAHQFIAGYTI